MQVGAPERSDVGASPIVSEPVPVVCGIAEAVAVGTDAAFGFGSGIWRLGARYSSYTGMEITSPAKRGVLSVVADNFVWQPTHPVPSGMAPARR